jgi:hypothetical protein
VLTGKYEIENGESKAKESSAGTFVILSLAGEGISTNLPQHPPKGTAGD